MGWFIVPALLVLLVIAGLVVRAKVNAEDGGFFGAVAAGLGLAILVGIVFFSSYTVVPPRNEGIVVEFGKATSSVPSGFHWVAPWSTVETVDATVQNINLTTDIGIWNTGACTAVTVRLANQTTACVDITLQWNVDRGANNINELWQKYRGSNDNVIGNIGHNVVDRQVRVALNEVFENYNPLSVLATGTKVDTTTLDLAQKALEILKANVDQGIQVEVLTIPLVHYDAVTQGKLNGYAQALADTQIATQQKLTAEQQRLANDILSKATSTNDKGVQYQNCLNLIKDLAAKSQLTGLPPTFNCGNAPVSVIVGQK